MELKFINISNKEFNNLNLTINSNIITGIYNAYNLEKLFNGLAYTGSILINDSILSSYNESIISYISLNPMFYTSKVKDEFYLANRKSKLNNQEYLKKIESILKIVKFDKEILEKEIRYLSTSEKYMLNIAINLISNPDIIILENNQEFDNNIQSIIKNIVLELKKKYKKTIIIISNNINYLYDLSDNIVIFKNNNIVASGKTNSLFKKENIPIPDLIKFSNLANSYNKKIKNYKDIKDLIKDVYKNV